MRQFPRESGDYALILDVGLGAVSSEKFTDHGILRGSVLVDGDTLPFIFRDLFIGRIVYDVESAKDIRSGSRLYDGDPVDYGRFVHKGVGVPSQNEVNAPVRVEKSGELKILFVSDMCEQHGHIGVRCAVVVADDPDLLRRVLDINKSPDHLFRPCGVQDLLGEDADEKDLQSIDLHVQIGLEQSLVVQGNEHIRVDDGKLRALFQKEEVTHSIVHFMVADGGHIGTEHIDEIDSGQSHIFGVDDGTAEHISADRIHDIWILSPGAVQISGKQFQSSGLNAAFVLGKKISVHIVGMEKG